jgi:hypothetical protein
VFQSRFHCCGFVGLRTRCQALGVMMGQDPAFTRGGRYKATTHPFGTGIRLRPEGVFFTQKSALSSSTFTTVGSRSLVQFKCDSEIAVDDLPMNQSESQTLEICNLFINFLFGSRLVFSLLICISDSSQYIRRIMDLDLSLLLGDCHNARFHDNLSSSAEQAEVVKCG